MGKSRMDESEAENLDDLSVGDPSLDGEDVVVAADRERDMWDELAETGNLPEAELPSSTELSAAELKIAEQELGSAVTEEIEELEFIDEDTIVSIVEIVLFATDRPLSLHAIKQAFQGTNIKNEHIRRAIAKLAGNCARAERGVTLEEVAGGYQLRTKADNMQYLRRLVKQRPFKLSGHALEVLSIVAYKQPVVKAEVDQIRGVESGHLVRALMEKGLVHFAGKSELPGKPMQYATGRKFLEIFGLRNLKELPALHEIDELIPEGIGDAEVEKKPGLDSITSQLSNDFAAATYSVEEEELHQIADQLAVIDTTTAFFEEQKRLERERRDKERAQGLREAITFGETVDPKDLKWLEKFERASQPKEIVLEAVEDATEIEAPTV